MVEVSTNCRPCAAAAVVAASEAAAHSFCAGFFFAQRAAAGVLSFFIFPLDGHLFVLFVGGVLGGTKTTLGKRTCKRGHLANNKPMRAKLALRNPVAFPHAQVAKFYSWTKRTYMADVLVSSGFCSLTDSTYTRVAFPPHITRAGDGQSLYVGESKSKFGCLPGADVVLISARPRSAPCCGMYMSFSPPPLFFQSYNMREKKRSQVMSIRIKKRPGGY